MNCNLDLRLSPPPESSAGEIPDDDRFNLKQLTIFYNGRICVCDVTELQARAIIWLASKQVEQGKYNDHRDFSLIANAYNSAASTSALQQCQASSSSSSSGMSMKKSLQAFLQKRKHRRRAASPYRN